MTGYVEVKVTHRAAAQLAKLPRPVRVRVAGMLRQALDPANPSGAEEHWDGRRWVWSMDVDGVTVHFRVEVLPGTGHRVTAELVLPPSEVEELTRPERDRAAEREARFRDDDGDSD